MSAQTTDFAAQLGRAWAHHRQGNNGNAITEFEGILASSKDNVDALYGLGLALRASGKSAQALEKFRLSLQGLENMRQQNAPEDRLAMLDRMIKQRISELEGTPAR